MTTNKEGAARGESPAAEWSNLRIALISAAIVVPIALFGYFLSQVDDIVHSVAGLSKNTSLTIMGQLELDESHPFIGLWRDHCSDPFGLAIDRAGDNLYSVSFCGPGGCFEPGTYRPNTPIVGDPYHRVIDTDTIDVSSINGFDTYHRCAE